MIQLHCIHGFLGRAVDWDLVLPRQLPLVRYDLFRVDDCMTLSGWARKINSQVATSQDDEAPASPKRVLLGYSLGGRIALETFFDNPKLWSGIVLVSTHPGFHSPLESEERKARLLSDQAWAKRFRLEDWDTLIPAWNAQPVFSGGGFLPRNIEDFSRSTLAGVLEGCSLATQRNFRAELKDLSIPVLWISGSLDAKFRSVAEEMGQLNPGFQIQVIENAGHRAPWDQPQVFAQMITDYCNRLANHFAQASGSKMKS